MEGRGSAQATFQKLKVTCVPLLSNSLLTPSSIPIVSKLLTELTTSLRDVQEAESVLSPSLISYVFFPLSSLLRRNELSTIPDQILEKVLVIFAILCESWWWDMDEPTWEQIFMLCGGIIGGIDRKGKGRVRDDETREAATLCLWVILRERSPDEDPLRSSLTHRASRTLARFQTHVQNQKFTPIIGQTLNTLLSSAESSQLPLQRSSLKVLHIIVKCYLRDDFVPSVLPGVVSSMDKIALGVGVSKGWSNGDIVAGALAVMQEAIIRSIRDEICVRMGAVQGINDLEDLTELLDDVKPAASAHGSSYGTARTPAWLRGTVSQLHIAINALSPLVNHPTPAALFALSTFSASVLSSTTLTLPQSQPLLLSFLLSLTGSTFDRISNHADTALRQLLAPPSTARHTLLQGLMQISRDNLAILPRLLLSHADAKVEHVAGLIEAVCRLATAQGAAERPGIPAISVGVGKLLGPHGGIEKWGWSLLSTLEFINPPVVVTGTSAAQLMLENDTTSANWVPFPELTFEHVASRSAHSALERMFRLLGQTAGEGGLFTIEWFVDVGQAGRESRAVAALWCACRLLEGVGGVSLDSGTVPLLASAKNKRVDKLARGLARRIAEAWDDIDEEVTTTQDRNPSISPDEDGVLVEHIRKIISIRTPVHYLRNSRSSIYSLATITSYASPANLLLSNFDYALDAVSRHLTHRWLDVDATKVLVVLVRLVGRGVVQKAGDVVEECFDRLDEFHGYEVVVDGLVEVLGEVVKIVEEDEESRVIRQLQVDTALALGKDSHKLDAFIEWFVHRNDPGPAEEPIRDDTYPREAWGRKDESEVNDENRNSKDADPNAELPPTPTQALTKQIVSRSLYFLTHSSPMIRARILMLLSSAVPVLPESALLPAINDAWPFILNRFSDPETFVISAAASLVESLAIHVGDFMYRRIWDDIWPRFRDILRSLDAADAQSALARRGRGAVGTESAYTASHRLYGSILRTMTAAAKGVQSQDSTVWEVIVIFRRFLHSHAHDELQACARELYCAIGMNNEDAVWLALSATQALVEGSVSFLKETKWDIGVNVSMILT
ncbi:TEL2-interacting protein 1 [Grifola frondosa]|uniref:TEL2-interacting protein 1 n=1 Tax=Grifola frondosa TaxID=5627 RepID=A0A1C7MRK9_GRIFR|nr:TEL2-interacting protein 1 [Grifola frondosa]